MQEYHKIQTVYKRDPATKMKTLLVGEYSDPGFRYLANNEWVFTEKVDGTNIRVLWDGERVVFGGRTDKAEIPNRLVNKLNDMFLSKKDVFQDIFKLEPDLSKGVCLYGEGYGAKIQKGGGNYRLDQGFVLFDVKIGVWWLERRNVEDIASQLGVDVVPIIGKGALSDMHNIVEKGFKSRWGDFTAEGIVARPAVELQFRSGRRVITKLKHKDFK